MNCDACCGFKGQPGVSYGYAGRWCACNLSVWDKKSPVPLHLSRFVSAEEYALEQRAQRSYRDRRGLPVYRVPAGSRPA